MRTTMQLTMENAGAVRQWCEANGATRAIIRGGRGGGSKGATVIVIIEGGAPRRFEVMLGDTVEVMAGVGLVLREGDRP